MTEYIFFSGKGGVGKTTMACATAVHYAEGGRKTLIVTTDPASNLSDVFQQEIGHRVVRINGVDNLHAMEIDPDEAIREYRERVIGPYRGVMPDDVIASMEENLRGACTTEMAAFDRFIDFMESDEYDVVVFDTAPTGHTIRMLELPVEWSRHIEDSAKGSGQTCLGPVQAIQDSKERYDRTISILRNPERTRFIFVMRPEELSLYETLRSSGELEDIGIKTSEVIINGLLPNEVCDILFFKRIYSKQQDVIKEADTLLKAPKRYMLLRDDEVKGIDSLRDVAGELFKSSEVQKCKSAEVKKKTGYFETSALPLLRTSSLDNLFLPQNGTKAIFFTGKGGVGKTTISCITAVYLSERGYKTLLVTTDPASHIAEVLDSEVRSELTMITDNLYAVMIDQKDAFREYKKRVLDEAKERYSEDMLRMMEEELNSPCIEEMAAFERFATFIESDGYDVVVFDTAPTGHTLRLLELPFDYTRQVETMMATSTASAIHEQTHKRFMGIIDRLRDINRTTFCIVLYPESTPIEEAYRAMLDLRDAGVETQLVIANMVIPEDVCTNDFFRNRRLMQLRYLREIEDRFKLPLLVYPTVDEEIRGIERLRMAGSVF
jgi:arsenite-transporting ATPase